jgi:hypothetical protein
MTAAQVRNVCSITGIKPPEDVQLYPRGDFEASFVVEDGKEITRITDMGTALNTMADWDQVRWRTLRYDITSDVT